MSSLARRLDEIREGAADRIPGQVREVMKRATGELKARGIEERVLRPGAPAPRFARPDPDGATVRLDSLLRKGPVILSFFRGRW